MFLPLIYFKLSALFNFLSCTFICILLLYRTPHIKMNRIFAYLSFTIAYWNAIYIYWCDLTDKELSEYLIRTIMIGVVFHPTTFFHFVTLFLKLSGYAKIHAVNYAISTILGISVYSPYYANDLQPFLVFPYWLKANVIFHLAISHFGFFFAFAFFLLWQRYKELEGTDQAVYRNQILYLLTAVIIGCLGGSTNYFSWYRIPIPPFGMICISLMMIIITYAIIKHKLMNIEVIIKKTVVFAGLSLSVLGVVGIVSFLLPAQLLAMFGLRLEPFWLNLLSVAIVSLLFNRVRRFLVEVTDQYLFQKPTDYKLLLRRFTDQVVEMIDLRQLIQMTVLTLSESMKLTTCSLWLRNPDEGDFILQAQRGLGEMDGTLTPTHSFVSYLREHHEPLCLDDSLKVKDLPDTVEIQLSKLKGQLCVPLILQDEFIGFLTLGKKKSDKNFTGEDVDTLRPLSGTLAIAISNTRLFKELAQKEIEATTDELTGLLVRRAFIQQATKVLTDLSLARQPSSLFMIDLDHFKEKNDTHGHLVGDAVLKETAHRLTQMLRTSDVIGRFGGEEFIILLPSMTQDQAKEVAERLRQHVQARPISTQAGALHQTISVGLASRSERATTLQDLILKADQALYQAKRNGRNRVEITS